MTVFFNCWAAFSFLLISGVVVGFGPLVLIVVLWGASLLPAGLFCLVFDQFQQRRKRAEEAAEDAALRNTLKEELPRWEIS